jgi:hypothetical protein
MNLFSGALSLAGLTELIQGNNSFSAFKKATTRSVTEAASEPRSFATAHQEPLIDQGPDLRELRRLLNLSAWKLLAGLLSPAPEIFDYKGRPDHTGLIGSL